MRREHVADYETELLLPARMEDWVGPRHLARYVREFVESIDLESTGFHFHDASTGRKGLSPCLLLSAWLYGYLTKQKSTRALERACQCDMGAIWLTGNHQPDHSTLWAFFNVHRKAFKEVMKESALVACRLGLVDLGFVAIDGSKLRASANGVDAICAEDLEIARDALDQEIERFVKEIESAGDQACEQLPEQLKERSELRKAIAENLAELKKIGTSRLSPVDPDARPMKTKEGNRLAYNAQVAVDSKNGIVIACDVSQDAHDSSLLNHMIDQVQDCVGLLPDLAAADSGYFSAAELALAEQKRRPVAVSMRGKTPGSDQPFHSWLFHMDEERNVVVCPIGSELLYRGMTNTAHGKDTVHRFHCKDHHFCPFATQCSSDKRGRVVEINIHRAAALRQWERQKGPEYAEVRKKRQSTVERVFGHAKRNLGLRNLEHRGIESVQAVWSLAICATNMITLARHAGFGR